MYSGDLTEVGDMAAFAAEADVLLCDATFTDAQWHAGMPHISARMAAKLALDARVGQLVLIHCPPTNDAQTLLREAREVFQDTISAYSGLIISL